MRFPRRSRHCGKVLATIYGESKAHPAYPACRLAGLEPYRNLASGKLWSFHEIKFQEHFRDLCGRAKVTRKSNGLRHAFCSHHFALHSNENLTAAQASNFPRDDSRALQRAGHKGGS